MKFKGTKNFSISELEASTTAQKYKIDNTIPDEFEGNARRLLIFLQDLRDKWGSAITITSGFRSEKLNKLINGSKTSAHLKCNAADLWPANGNFEEFKKFIKSYLNGRNWDQCFIERSGKHKWIHLGLYSNTDKQRRQLEDFDK